MRTRKDTVKFFAAMHGSNWEKPLIPNKHAHDYWGDVPYHWGLCEFRALLDFIYGGPPTSPDEHL